MRVKKSLYNVVMTAVYYVQTTIIGLFLRKVFLETLGIDYVGLDTVLANILSFLALVELGIGPAITYRLYKPLAQNDTYEVSCLMAVYKRFYRIVAFAVCVLGIIISFFITSIVKDSPLTISQLKICYFIFLSSSVTSYLLAYKRSLLVADQRQYTTVIVDILVNLGIFVAKIIVLYLTHNYILVLLLNTLRVIASNVIVSYICNRNYPFLKTCKIARSDINKKSKNMLPDISYILLHKFCNYVYASTDGIVISTIKGVGSVGLLANYNLIVNVVSSLFMQCSSSIQSSIGNLVSSIDGGTVAVKTLLNRLSYLYFVILSFCACSLYVLLTPFIRIWLGSEYAIPQSVIAVICLNLFIYSFYQPIANLYTVLGLFKGDKITSLLAAVVNLLASVILVKSFGLIGVYAGTILGSITYLIGRTQLVYKYYFKESPYKYFRKIIFYTLIATVETGIAYYVTSLIGEGIMCFVAKMVICILLPNIFNIILFCKTEECLYFFSLIKRFIKKGL